MLNPVLRSLCHFWAWQYKCHGSSHQKRKRSEVCIYNSWSLSRLLFLFLPWSISPESNLSPVSKAICPGCCTLPATKGKLALHSGSSSRKPGLKKEMTSQYSQVISMCNSIEFVCDKRLRCSGCRTKATHALLREASLFNVLRKNISAFHKKQGCWMLQTRPEIPGRSLPLAFEPFEQFELHQLAMTGLTSPMLRATHP